MSLFDKIKNVGKMIQEDVKKIPTDEIKERLSDVKNVLSESYSQTKDKLDEKNKNRNLINNELKLLKSGIDYTNSLSEKNAFSNYLNPDKEDILELYKDKKVRSYEDIKSLNLIKYKGLNIFKPGFSLSESSLDGNSIDVKSVLSEKEVVSFEIEEEVVTSLDNDNIPQAKENLEESEIVLGKSDEVEINNEATLGDLNIVDEVNLSNTETNELTNYYLALDYEYNFDKLVELIWRDILVLREKEIVDLNIKKYTAEKLVETCVVCNAENHIDSFVHRPNLICSDKCYTNFKNLVLTLNNTKRSIEEELKLLNNSFLNKKNDYLSDENNIKKIFSNLNLSDLKDNDWVVVPNSFILRNELPDGEILYVGYDIICKVNNEGLLEILIYQDLLTKKNIIEELILKDEKYNVLKVIFN